MEQLEQYPDSIVVTWLGEPSQNTTTGEYTAGASNSHTFDCRAEVNTQSRQINGNDGSLIDYSYDVYMPLTDVVIPDFIADYVLNSTISGKVKRAHNGQLNSRLWL